MINNVVWIPIKNYEDLYEISNTGEVKSIRSGNLLKQSTTTTGYKKVELYRNRRKRSMKVHRLVAIAFLPNEENKPIVNHIDGVPTNNNINNLEWCDQKYNMQHAYDTGLISSNLHAYKTELIKEYSESDISLRGLAKKYKVSPKSLSKLLNRNNVRVRSKRESKDVYKINREEMIKMFKEGKNNKEIADYFKTNKSLIATYRYKYKKGELIL